MRISESLYAWGHPAIVATHDTTFEVTRESRLTRRGDCVIAVQATKALTDMSEEFRQSCRNDNAEISIELEASGIVESIRGRGSSRLTFHNAKDIVVRKSTYVSDRTLMIHADKAASDINRTLVEALKSPKTRLHVRLTVEL